MRQHVYTKWREPCQATREEGLCVSLSSVVFIISSPVLHLITSAIWHAPQIARPMNNIRPRHLSTDESARSALWVGYSGLRCGGSEEDACACVCFIPTSSCSRGDSTHQCQLEVAASGTWKEWRRGKNVRIRREKEQWNSSTQNTYIHTWESIPLRRADQCEAVCPSVLCRDMAFLPLEVGKKKQTLLLIIRPYSSPRSFWRRDVDSKQHHLVWCLTKYTWVITHTVRHTDTQTLNSKCWQTHNRAYAQRCIKKQNKGLGIKTCNPGYYSQQHPIKKHCSHKPQVVHSGTRLLRHTNSC